MEHVRVSARTRLFTLNNSNNQAEAISEGAEHFEIDADACLDCGTCADACPTEAIHPAE